MFYETDLDSGKITLDNAVLGSIIIQEAATTEGKIILCSSKGKPIKQPVKRNGDDGNFFDYNWNESNLDIIVYVIIKLGGSINTIAEKFNERLRIAINELLGIQPASITVNIKGILSKNISDRDIRITTRYL